MGELFDELRAAGFEITAGQMGENITTAGLDPLALPADAKLHLGNAAIVVVTGLRIRALSSSALGRV